MKKVLLFVFLTGCGSKCYNNYYFDITNLPVNINLVTPNGINVDTSGYEVDVKRLDNRINNIEKCLLEVSKTEDNKKWDCLRETIELNRDCFKIKIVPPIYSKCSDWEFIDVLALEQGCLDKGIIPTTECPCRWRTAIQNSWTIITPPKLYLWEMGRIMTSCNQVWKSPYAKCLTGEENERGN
jgi:hypothetical protein